MGIYKLNYLKATNKAQELILYMCYKPLQKQTTHVCMFTRETSKYAKPIPFKHEKKANVSKC